MAPRPPQWLPDRTWDTPTKGLLWSGRFAIDATRASEEQPVALRVWVTRTTHIRVCLRKTAQCTHDFDHSRHFGIANSTPAFLVPKVLGIRALCSQNNKNVYQDDVRQRFERETLRLEFAVMTWRRPAVFLTSGRF